MRRSLAAVTIGLLVAATPAGQQAEASRSDARAEIRSTSQARPAAARPVAHRQAGPARARGGPAGISCVPYARAVTGMEIRGNGRDWWHNAAGLYARGQRPEPGSVLAFPASGGMRMGHVAVVSRVVNARTIEIDHANWGGPGIRRGQVMRGVRVIDVSDDNSWTAVRVQTGWTAENFGRVYPTYGFIHNRPATVQAGRDQGWTPVVVTHADVPPPPARRPAAAVAARR